MNPNDPQTQPPTPESYPEAAPQASPPPHAPPTYYAPPGAAAAPRPRRKSAVLAGILSLMPGLGQIYVGHYQRGFIHVLVIACTIAILSGGTGDGEMLTPLLGFFISFYWLYNIIDASRLANAYNDLAAGATAEERIQLAQSRRSGSVAGGILLLLFGTLIFLNTMFDISLRWLENWWPIAPIGLGVYLLCKGLKDRQRPESQ